MDENSDKLYRDKLSKRKELKSALKLSILESYYP